MTLYSSFSFLDPLPTQLPSHDPPTLRTHQGWAIDTTHPSRSILNLENIFHHLDNLYPVSEADDNPKRTWTRDVESFVMAHTKHLLTSPLFVRAPIGAVQRILALPNLSVTEDFVLKRVLHYAADAANVLSESPAFWTEQERELVLPVLLQLFPYIRTYSLSPEEFQKTVEPMRILDTAELVHKYRFDALGRQLSGEAIRAADGYSLAVIKRCYKDVNERRQILQHRLRGIIAVSESAHPYAEGEDDQVLEEVAVAPWAPCILVEFDRRSCIGLGGRLMFYRDRDAKEVIGSWHDMWPRGRHGIKSFVVNNNKFYVGFRSCFFDQTTWGWKLIATPLFQAQDFD